MPQPIPPKPIKPQPVKPKPTKPRTNPKPPATKPKPRPSPKQLPNMDGDCVLGDSSVIGSTFAIQTEAGTDLVKDFGGSLKDLTKAIGGLLVPEFELADWFAERVKAIAGGSLNYFISGYLHYDFKCCICVEGKAQWSSAQETDTDMGRYQAADIGDLIDDIPKFIVSVSEQLKTECLAQAGKSLP